jgi:hypothetical protein
VHEVVLHLVRQNKLFHDSHGTDLELIERWHLRVF